MLCFDAWALLWLIAFSGVVLSCFKLFRSATTDFHVSIPYKTEGIANPIVCGSSLFSVKGQDNVPKGKETCVRLGRGRGGGRRGKGGGKERDSQTPYGEVELHVLGCRLTY